MILRLQSGTVEQVLAVKAITSPIPVEKFRRQCQTRVALIARAIAEGDDAIRRRIEDIPS
ncbi:MAG: hypothetical protein GDA53_00745 [Rhodobacteraceae bacterium]|nr:hypothetical protein [Paracoccaceae bacterium]